MIAAARQLAVRRLAGAASSTSCTTFGEEWGWRGYLVPKVATPPAHRAHAADHGRHLGTVARAAYRPWAQLRHGLSGLALRRHRRHVPVLRRRRDLPHVRHRTHGQLPCGGRRPFHHQRHGPGRHHLLGSLGGNPFVGPRPHRHRRAAAPSSWWPPSCCGTCTGARRPARSACRRPACPTARRRPTSRAGQPPLPYLRSGKGGPSNAAFASEPPPAGRLSPSEPSQR